MASEQNNITSDEDSGFFVKVFYEIFTSPLHLCLLGIITFLVYKIFKSQQTSMLNDEELELDLPKMKKTDFTLEQLRPYDGNGPNKRILVAVNGKVFDVTKGRRFYGPGGPYAAFGGKDASRGLATFSVTGRTEYDDLSDLNSVEMDSVREWEMQFTERYDYVGKLLRPGQEPSTYSDDEEEEASQPENSEKSKDE